VRYEVGVIVREARKISGIYCNRYMMIYCGYQEILERNKWCEPRGGDENKVEIYVVKSSVWIILLLW